MANKTINTYPPIYPSNAERNASITYTGANRVVTFKEIYSAEQRACALYRNIAKVVAKLNKQTELDVEYARVRTFIIGLFSLGYSIKQILKNLEDKQLVNMPSVQDIVDLICLCIPTLDESYIRDRIGV